MMKTEKNGIITLSNSLAECKISLWGGNILSYRPKTEQHDVFWLGERNKFDGIQAIRGGIPVCWPRFAEEKLNNNLPRHGFARLSDWVLEHIEVDEKQMEAELSLPSCEKFGLNVAAKLFIKVTDRLECCLETLNAGDDDFKFSEALHVPVSSKVSLTTQSSMVSSGSFLPPFSSTIYAIKILACSVVWFSNASTNYRFSRLNNFSNFPRFVI